MVVNILLLIVLLLVAVGFILLARRAWRARKGFVRWAGVIFSGLLALVFTAVVVVAAIGMVRLNVSPYQYATVNIPVTGSADQVTRGEKLAHVCIGCHSSTGALPLDGSKDDFLAGGGPPFGSFYAPNLTPGGPLKDWSDAEIARAMREGVDNQGRPLIIMPSEPLHHLSDADTAAIIAYLRSQPVIPSRHEPHKNLNLVAAIFFGAGLFPTSAQPPITQPISAPALGTAEYGKYLVTSMGCADCHGKSYAGTPGGQVPAGPNLTAVVPKMSEQDFINVFRTGKGLNGRPLSDEMPWKDYNGAFSDAELKDIFQFMHDLQPLPNFANGE
ncbi:MAG TPA: cytochrome c [Anaerolineaceae bacterium]|nr:cytochrome c [Anaerolineaceae bacterium]